MAKGDLTDKQAAFITAFVETNNATEAYRRAYSTKNMKEATINREAHELLKTPKIAARIAELKKGVFDAAKLTIERIVEEYMRIAFLDPGKLYRSDGSLVPMHELDEDTRRAVAAIDVIEMAGKGGEDDAPVVVTKKMKLVDKLGALNDLTRYMGGFIDRKELTGKDGAPLGAGVATGVLVVPAQITSMAEWEKLARASAPALPVPEQ